MSDFISDLNAALKYGHDDVQTMLHLLSSPEHAATRQGDHPDADHVFRGALADAIDESDRPHAATESALLRDPQQHVIVHQGEVRPGKFTAYHIDSALSHFNDRIGHALPYPYAQWNVTELEHRPGWYTMTDGEGHDEYRLSHPAQALGPSIADHLQLDVDHFADDMDPRDVKRLRQSLASVRNAPYETVDTAHPTEKARQAQ